MQNTVAKKLFAIGVAASTALMALAPFAAKAAVHADGTNISDSSGTVYMIISGQRRPYTSAGAFLSYGFNSFASVVQASAEDLALPVGSFIPPQDGKIICSDRGADKGTCYLITGGQKAGFTSAAVFTGLGFSFSRTTMGDVSWMTSTSNIDNTTAGHRTGVLVNNGGTVQLVGANGLLGIPDLATFNSWGYSFADVVPANAADKTLTQTGVMAARVAGQLSPNWTTNPGDGNNPPVQNGNVSASLSSDNPAGATLVSATSGSQAGADLAHFVFSGTGTVTQVVVKRIGVSADTTLNNVYLYQGNNRITDAGSLSNGQVTFSNSNGLFNVNGSVTISVKVDVANSASAGQTLGIQLASFAVANGTPLTTSISGNLFTVATVTDLATVKINGTDNTAITGPGATVDAGTTNVNVWSAPVTVSQRAVQLKYFAFRQIGSIAQSAVQNLRLYVDGNQVGNSASITSSGSNTNVVIFDLTGSPYTLTTGGHTIELHGDVVGGTNFNFDFVLQQATDAILYDTSYNVNVPLTWTNNQQILQVGPSAATTVNFGTISVQLDPSFTATQFVKNASQVTLGQWTFKAYGEDVKVQNLKVALNYFLSDGSTPVTPSSSDGFSNLSVFVNGGQVGSSQNATTPADATPSYTFGSTNLFTIPAGTTVTVAVKGDSVFSTSDATAAVRADLVTPTNSLQGVTSYKLTPASDTPYTGVSLTTSASTATLAKNTSYTDQTVGPNQTNQKIGSFVIQAGNADGVRVNTVNIGLTGTLNNNNVTQGLANLYIVTPTGNATPVNPSATSTFSTNFTIPANQTATVDVFADISNATGTIVTNAAVAGVGSTSNQSVTFNSAAGQQITVGSGTVNNPILQTSSPVAQFVIGGSTNQPSATFNFVAATGGATIQELTFYASSTQAGAITSVTVGGVTSPVVGATSTITGLNIAVPTNYSGVDVPVTVNYANVGLNGVASNQEVKLVLRRVKYLSGSTTKYLPTSGYTDIVSSNPMLLVGSAPTISLTASSNTLTTGAIIGSIAISANAAGNIIASTVPFTLSTNNASLSGNLKLVDASSGVIAGQVSAAVATSSSANVTVTLTTDNNIAAGTTKTYNIVLGTVVTESGANNFSATVGMGDAASFKFRDVNGGDAIGDIAGKANGNTYIVNYPTNTVTSHQ